MPKPEKASPIEDTFILTKDLTRTRNCGKAEKVQLKPSKTGKRPYKGEVPVKCAKAV